ncbi:MAG: hypothetical protein ACK50Q_11530 [Labrys sp. (in: a-proteobacteria)]
MIGARLAAFQPLMPAEAEVVAALQSGDFDRIGAGSRPAADDMSRAVRAELLRFLLLGGEEGARPHEKGIRVRGAYVIGILDLEGCRIPRDIGLRDCRFEHTPVLQSAIIDNLFLDGSVVPGLKADRLEARGTVSIQDAAIAGSISLNGARLGGNLDCDRSVIAASGVMAIQAEDIEARGILLRSAEVRGRVRFSGARLTADLDCVNLHIQNAGDIAIDAGAIETRGSVVLRGAEIKGDVRLVSARIDGDLDAADVTISSKDRFALQLNNAVVRGAFFLKGRARIEGALDLRGATLGTIQDAAECWPGKGDLLLNRCLYQAFIGGPADTASRLRWLALQTPERWGEDFWPQPYEQLATVFREMGHDEEARAVLIARERLQRRARRERETNPVLRALLKVSDVVLAVTVLYGRQPLLAFAWLLLFWLIGVGVFHAALENAALKPNSAVVLRSTEWILCGVPKTETRFLVAVRQDLQGLAEPGQAQLDCFLARPEADSYPAFNPWMYSLETLFPVLEIDQKTFWRPDPSKPGGGLALFFFYFQSTVGWILSLLAVAGFSGLVKSQ